MRCVSALAAVFAAALAGAAGTDDALAPRYVFTSAPRYDAGAWQHAGERFPQGAAVMLAAATNRRKIAPQFYASADPAVSFDGSRILFAGKSTAAARWQIWEVPVEGGAPRQVARTETDCIRPLYVPGGGVAFTQISPRGSHIEIVAAEGGAPQRLTFAPGWYLTNDVLHDGRILFENSGELFTVYPDGTGVESLRCDHGPRRADGRQVASGDVIFGAGNRLARFRSALAVQVDVAQPDLEPAGPIAEVSPGKWLVSLRRRGGAFGLYLWTQESGRLQALEIRPGVNALQPAVVSRRTPPREFPSGLVPTRTTGHLLCLNARESKMPAGGNGRAVAVYTLDAAGAESLLGRQSLAGDGSFYVEVPSDRPLRIEVLDVAGHAVGAEHGWFWMRPSEPRVCVGCHMGPERSPENKVPEILLQTIVPAKLLGQTK